MDSMTTGLRVVAKAGLTSRAEVSSTDLYGFICPRGVSCPTFPPSHCHHDFPLTVTRSSLSVEGYPLCSFLPSLHIFNAQLSPERWKPRSQEVGSKGDYTQRYTVTIRATGRNPDPGKWGKWETIPNDTLTTRMILHEDGHR